MIIRFFAAALLTLENSPGALRPHRSLAGLRSSRVNPRYRFCISGSCCCCCCACLWPAYSMGSICWLLGSCANSSLSKSCKYNEGSRSVRRPTDLHHGMIPSNKNSFESYTISVQGHFWLRQLTKLGGKSGSLRLPNRRRSDGDRIAFWLTFSINLS